MISLIAVLNNEALFVKTVPPPHTPFPADGVTSKETEMYICFNITNGTIVSSVPSTNYDGTFSTMSKHS